MSDTESVALRNQPPMPEYFRKDRIGRGEYLSQLGHFSEEHRSLFNRLCDFWEPVLPYNKFFSKAGHEFMNADTALETLMSHLEAGRTGLLVPALREGELKPATIILSERDDDRFWYWLVEKEWQENLVSDRKTFPNVAAFQETRRGISRERLIPLSLAEISTRFIENHRDEVSLFVLPDIDELSIIVTPATLTHLISASRLKIRVGLSDSPLLPVIARLMGTVVSDVKKELHTNDDTYWNRLSDAIVVHREDLMAKKAILDPEVFVAAKILKIYTRNEIDETNRRREEETEKREKLKAVVNEIAQKDDFVVTLSELDQLLDPYLEAWPDFKELFFGNYLKPSGRTGIPPIVVLNDGYIYRDHLYPLFRDRHKTATLELRAYYTDLMERVLRTNNRDRLTVFSGRQSFREDILEKVNEEYPVLMDLLNKPRMVSEGVIHYATKVLKVPDMDRVKEILERYFDEGIIRYKSSDKLFDLYLKLLFQDAFHRLPWLRRLFMKLLGKYDGYVRAYSGSTAVKEPGRPILISDEEGEDAVPMAPRARGGRRKNRGRHELTYEDRPRRKKRKGADPQSRYSRKQQEQAWDEFREAYQKKNKNEPAG